MRVLFFLASLPLAAQPMMPACAAPSAESLRINATGLKHHQDRALGAASRAYTEVLKLAPPRDPNAAERALIRRFAPRLLVTPAEFFPLKDFAAILHPERPWIAFHLFWEDDIDFPDDNDPCDHEVVWVQLDRGRERIEGYVTYFHSRQVQSSPAAVEDARRNNGRPAVWVQWGKHGSMPAAWDGLEAGNRRDYERLHTTGRMSADSPLGKGWPLKFTGTWKDFTDFSRIVDPAPLLDANGMEKVSWFSNAVLNRHFLRYNFAAKTEWPELVCGGRK
ncbi:MAG: hypothetical protein HY235_06560 [Acidobacteria bacterium]|nr:hypothetical protein [Acidobacteriota bacterium]